MKSILEELFYGNVCPGTDFRSKDAKARKLMAHLADHHETFAFFLSATSFLYRQKSTGISTFSNAFLSFI